MSVVVGKRRSHHRRTLASPVLADIVRRVVAVAKPEQIVLFGSAARGTMGPNSDVDLLIVKSGRFHRGRLTEAIYRGLAARRLQSTSLWQRPKKSSGIVTTLT